MWQAFFLVFYCEEEYMNNPELGLYENSVKKARAEMAYDKIKSLNSGRKILSGLCQICKKTFDFKSQEHNIMWTVQTNTKKHNTVIWKEPLKYLFIANKS